MTDNTDEDLRAYAARLFSRAEVEAAAEPEPAPANHVPSEGNNPTPPPDPNETVRQFVADLFY